MSMIEYRLGNYELEQIENHLEDLKGSGIHYAIMIDLAGNVIAQIDDGEKDLDIYSFAALASANYAAVEGIAHILGEPGFSLLFHKGKQESTNFTKLNEEFILITIFGSRLPLSLLRLKIEDISKRINSIWR